MAKYRKKPVVIDAIQWFKMGDHPEVESLYPNWDKTPPDYQCPLCGESWGEHGAVKTLESASGHHTVCPRDWVITGVKGEHYACKPDIFEQTYEFVK